MCGMWTQQLPDQTSVWSMTWMMRMKHGWQNTISRCGPEYARTLHDLWLEGSDVLRSLCCEVKFKKSLVCFQRLLSNSRGPRLSEDAFEGIIDSFEKGLHRVLGQRTELWPNVIEASADAPDIEGIFPLAEACSLPVSPLSNPGSTFCRHQVQIVIDSMI